jgi:hypothetical protein
VTAFTTSNLSLESRGEYLVYRTDLTCREFVARFKHVKYGRAFAAFLRKNFTVEEYFNRLNAGEAPLTILESKGFVPPHIRRWAAEGRAEAQAYIARRAS